MAEPQARLWEGLWDANNLTYLQGKVKLGSLCVQLEALQTEDWGRGWGLTHILGKNRLRNSLLERYHQVFSAGVSERRCKCDAEGCGHSCAALLTVDQFRFWRMLQINNE